MGKVLLCDKGGDDAAEGLTGERLRGAKDGPDGYLGVCDAKLGVDSGGGVLEDNLGDTLGEVESCDVGEDIPVDDFLTLFKGLAGHGGPARCGKDVV